MNSIRNSIAAIFGIACAAGSAGIAHAQISSDATVLAASKASAVARSTRALDVDQREVSKIGTAFAAFAGSNANARALATGLRNGSSITLSGAAGTKPVTFVPLTKAMGYGSVNIALSLAQQSLAKTGISQPTPAQIAAALNGGSIATVAGGVSKTVLVPGVLQMRSTGQGWGNIAQGFGAKLGRRESGVAGESDLRTRTVTVIDTAGRSTSAIEATGRGTVAIGNSTTLTGVAEPATRVAGALDVSGHNALSANAGMRGATLNDSLATRGGVQAPIVPMRPLVPDASLTDSQRALVQIHVGR